MERPDLVVAVSVIVFRYSFGYYEVLMRLFATYSILNCRDPDQSHVNESLFWNVRMVLSPIFLFLYLHLT